MLKRTILLSLSCCMFIGCGTKISDASGGSAGPAVISPDYKEVTIPSNIAPLNYRYAMNDIRSARTTFRIDGKTAILRGTEVKWKLKKWKSFVSGAAGRTMEVKATVKANGKVIEDAWSIYISEDNVDPYLTYRLIEPAYQMWNEGSIEERCVENFKETTICDYRQTDNSCMNCHVHGQQRGDLSLFYIRGTKGGAILNRDGELRKLTLKTDDMISGTVYGELHPSGRFGVFSTNIIISGLHTHAGDRMEVYDTSSDLTVADFDNNIMINVPEAARQDALETFPCFSADGNSVFYCIADTVVLPERVHDLRYSLVKAPFDISCGVIGPDVDTLWNGNIHDASVCHPKASPDGRWLMFTVSSYGTFPLYHTDCTLNLMDLRTGEVHVLDDIKGDKSDTYHSWSSDGHWFVFASKRWNGQFGKPYYCHIDDNGNVSKPFVLPQKSPDFYDYFLKSFNVPDIGRESVGITSRDSRKMFNAMSEPFSSSGQH